MFLFLHILVYPFIFKKTKGFIMNTDIYNTDYYTMDREIMSTVKATEQDQWDNFIFND